MLITDKTDITDNTENTNPNWHVLPSPNIESDCNFVFFFPKLTYHNFFLCMSYLTGFEDNFVKLVENVTIDHLGTDYDYGSVMHYPGDAFAINEDVPTIITKDPEAQDEIGQRVRMSEADIERVQILYSCVSAVSA